MKPELDDIRSFYHSLQPVLLPTKVLGIFPFKVSKNKSEIFVSTNRDILLSFIMFLVTIVAGVISLYTNFVMGEEEKVLIGVYAVYLTFLHLNTTLGIAIITFKRKKVAMIFKYLFQVDQFLSRSAVSIMYKNTRRGLFKSLGLVLLYLSIVTACLIFYFTGPIEVIIQTFPEMLSIMINTLMLFQYAAIARALSYRYNQLYNILKELPDVESQALFLKWITGHIYSQTHAIDPLKIKVLRQQHLNLFNAVCLLNEVYGFIILLEVSTALINCVASLYNGISMLKVDDNMMESIAMIIAGTQLLAPIIWLILVCHQVTKQREKHATVVQKLIVSSSLDNMAQTHLKEFLGQISILEQTFSAAGFFQLDLPFICTALSAIFTYFIIMAQAN